MKVNIEDIRRQYAELSDEGLYEIDREDLVDLARRCYDEELARRKITPPPAAAPEVEAPAHIPEDLVVAGEYPSQEEARLARELVRSAGITGYLGNEDTVRMANVFGNQILLVAADDLEYAREILAAKVTDEDLDSQATADTGYIRHGVGAVRPYIYGRLNLLGFVQHVFDAMELERHEFSPTARHLEVRIGDSVVVMELSDPPHSTAAPAQIYVYVQDVDAAYARALEAGGVGIAAPVDKPYDERCAAVKDSFGNTWWISTYTAA